MSDYLSEHWVLSIIATIVLGAIGSGLWDAGLKPVSRKLGGALFTMITFGAKRSRDKIYKNAAMGHHELPSLYILLIVFLAAISFLVLSQLRLYIAIYAPDASTALVSKCAEKEESKKIECVKEQVNKRMIPTLQVISLISIFMSVFILYRFATINRANLVTTYYEQCIRSAKPFLGREKFLLIEQKYSQMKTKEDYDDLIKELSEVMQSNGASLPESYL